MIKISEDLQIHKVTILMHMLQYEAVCVNHKLLLLFFIIFSGPETSLKDYSSKRQRM